MFIDNEGQFTTQGTAGQSLNGFAVATTALANVIDSGPLGGQNTPSQNQGRDFGMGFPSWIYWLTIAAITSGGSPTVDVQLVSSAAATLTSPNVMLDLTGGAIAYNATKLSAGTALRYELPRLGPYSTNNTAGWLRYIGVNVIVATAALTGGTVNCFLTRDLQDNTLYVAGFLVQ